MTTSTKVWLGATVVVVTLGLFIALVQGVFTNPHTSELADAEYECDTEFDIGTQRYESIGGYVVFESRSEPRTYAVVEKHMSSLHGHVRRTQVFCDVDPAYWEQPETWPWTGRNW